MTAAVVYALGLACVVLALVLCLIDLWFDMRRPGMTEQDVRLTLYGRRGR